MPGPALRGAGALMMPLLLLPVADAAPHPTLLAADPAPPRPSSAASHTFSRGRGAACSMVRSGPSRSRRSGRIYRKVRRGSSARAQGLAPGPALEVFAKSTAFGQVHQHGLGQEVDGAP